MLCVSVGRLPLHWRAKRYEADVDVDGNAHTTWRRMQSRGRREVLYRVIQPLSAGVSFVQPVSRNDDEVAPLMDALLCTCPGLFHCPMLKAELWPASQSVGVCLISVDQDLESRKRVYAVTYLRQNT